MKRGKTSAVLTIKKNSCNKIKKQRKIKYETQPTDCDFFECDRVNPVAKKGNKNIRRYFKHLPAREEELVLADVGLPSPSSDD